MWPFPFLVCWGGQEDENMISWGGGGGRCINKLKTMGGEGFS